MREQRNSSSSCGRPDASPSSSSSSSNSGGGSGSGEGSGGGCGGTTTGAVQFIAIRSRVGKRYQATIPDMLGEDARATKKQAVHIPNPQFCLDRANDLGNELDKYLKLARTLRDGATFDTEEQIDAIALQYLHRFNYNPTDAACSLYARHSVEVPKTSSASPDAGNSKASSSDEEVSKWLTDFYRYMRVPTIHAEEFKQMKALHEKAQSSADIIALTEAAVLGRLVTRIATWEEKSAAVAAETVDRGELLLLLHEAGDMHFVVPQREALCRRIRDFDSAFAKLKDAVDRGSRRNQAKAELNELESLYLAVTDPNISFPEEEQYHAIVQEAKELKSTISSMLKEEKVSLPAMREVIAKIELVPVNFEREVDLFQKKMLSAQNWLAKARKCIPKRRATRRGGSSEPKKMDLDAIRALVDDAPCDDSAEMFEMQDLLECADEWAEKVKQAIEGGAEVQLEELKELFEEGNEMPVEMEEQKFLEAEIGAREWCAKAASMLAARKSLKDLEGIADQAKSIRTRIHPKKQSRWKPQVERDIHAAIDLARRWVNEVRDVLGNHAFERLFPGASSNEQSAHSSKADASHPIQERAKKPLDSIGKLLEKSDRLVIDVSSYVDALTDLQANGFDLREEVKTLLEKIGRRSPPENVETTLAPVPDSSSSMTTAELEQDKTSIASDLYDIGDFSYAASMLDRVFALPFYFEEGLELEKVISSERDWSQRVKDALPPRQSRKKRQSKTQITLAQLEQLLAESKHLHFRFPEEMKTLTKELEELSAWQTRARQAVEVPISDQIAQLVPKLRDYDMLVYDKLQAAKDRLAQTGAANQSTDAVLGDTKDTALMKHESNGVSSDGINVHKMEGDQRADASLFPPNGNVLDKPAQGDTFPSTKVDPSVGSVREVDAERIEMVLPIHSEAIMSHVRIESGCMQKQKKLEDEDEDATGKQKNPGEGKESISLLDPVLRMAEKSLEDISSLEFRDEKVKTLEEIELSTDPDSISFTDDAVKVLESWRDQVAQVLEEGELLSAIAPEQKSLATIVDLLTWLQSARSLFYDEMLPLRELVTRGKEIQEELKSMRSLRAMNETSMDVLDMMVWPIPYLEAQDKIVHSWSERVQSCISDKRVQVKTLQTLLNEGSSLPMEPDAFKIIHDEVKKAKAWLSKLKKRIKSLMTKRVGRLSIGIARSLVEEGEDVVIEMPVFDFLKENVEMASDWETRVLESGIESGQARIANLVSLLNEYDCAGLIIDMDMHRDVLKSATERYCICRQPFDGLMIGCDFCDDWFHDNCIGMSKEKAEKVENYTCPSCTILQDLSAAMQQVIEGQDTLWDQSEHVKSYEKQHGVIVRKLKREEKAIERSEMLLLSCNNQMNHLRVGIEDIERTKSNLSSTPQKAESKHSPPGATSASSAAESPNPLEQKSQSVDPDIGSSAALESKTEARHAPAADAKSVPSAVFSSNPVVPTNIPGAFASLQSVGFPHLYPNILLPPARYGSMVQHHTPISVLPLTSPSDPAKQLGTTNSNGLGSSVLTQSANKMVDANMERLSALVAAGDVEHQLAKMRSEHAELMVQAHDTQESLRLSRERLRATQDGLRELKGSHEARQRGLPIAQAWVRKAVAALNNTSALLSRSKIPSGGYLPDGYEAVISEIAPEQQIDHIFPEVRAYMRLLRLVGWSLVVVSLLQERPSRESLSSAIGYAGEHSLWESKTVSPLKGVLGRMDAWISKVHKSIAKAASKSQKVTRLKLLLNEYSKLPLTCALVESLEEHVKAAEMEAGGELTSDQVQQTQDAAEAAAIAAFAAAATALTASNVSTPSTAQQKPPRKRKPYTRREKTGTSGSSVKKSKTSVSVASTTGNEDGNGSAMAPEAVPPDAAVAASE